MTAMLLVQLLTYGGALAALANPFVGLLVYVSFSILKPECVWYESVPAGNYSRIVGLAMLAGWALRGFGNWRLGKGGAVVGVFAAFWCWVVVAAAVAANQQIAWQFVEHLTKIFLPILVAITTIDSTRKLKQLVWVIVLSQGIVAAALNLDYFQGFNRLEEVGFAGMDNNTTTAALVTCIGLAFFLGLGEKRWELKAVALGVALLIGRAILFSQSRGGMLALVAAGCISLVLIPRRTTHYIVLAIALIGFLQLSSPEARNRFQTIFAEPAQRDASAQNRLQLWRDNWDVTTKNPLFGCGPGHWPLLAHDYGWPAGMAGHCLWLQTGAEVGLPGLAFLVLFYAIAVVRLWPLVRMRSAVGDPWFASVARAVVVSLVAFAVSAQFLSVAALEVPYYIALVGAGLLKLSTTSQTTWQTSLAPAVTNQIAVAT